MGEIETEGYDGIGIEKGCRGTSDLTTVEIILKKIGPSPPTRLIVPSPIKVFFFPLSSIEIHCMVLFILLFSIKGC